VNAPKSSSNITMLMGEICSNGHVYEWEILGSHNDSSIQRCYVVSGFIVLFPSLVT
jgi:hypothetical protein